MKKPFTTAQRVGVFIFSGFLFGPQPAKGAQLSALDVPAPITLIRAACDAQGNTYILGTFQTSLTIAGKTLVSRGGTADYVLARYEPDGSVGWAISYGTARRGDGGSSVDSRTWLFIGPNGIFVTGSTPGSLHIQDTAGNVIDSAYAPSNRAGGGDGFLFCFSFTGVATWQASINGFSAGDAGRAVAFDASGNIYWVGSFNGCCPSQGGATLTGGDGTTVPLSSPSYGTAFLAKMSPVGTPMWVVKAYNRDTEFDLVTVDTLGGVYVGGFTRSWWPGASTIVVNSDGSTRSLSNPGLASHPFVKFNSAGILQWSASIFGAPGGNVDTDFAELYELCATTGDFIAVAGRYASSTVTFSSTDGAYKQLIRGNDYDGFVALYTPEGKAAWAVDIGGPLDQSVSALSAGTSDLWVGGTTTGGINMPGVALPGQGGSDGFVLQMDFAGNVLGAALVGGPYLDALTSLEGRDGLTMIAGNEGGSFEALGVQIPNAGPFVLTSFVPALDTENPVITGCPANITVGNDPNVCGAMVSWIEPTATDNVGVASFTSDHKPGDSFPVGTTTVTYTAKDAAGNMAVCSFTVTVEDLEKPVISGVALTPDNLWPANHKLVMVAVDYSTGDNCGVAFFSLSAVSNEPDNGLGDGDQPNDIQLIPGDQHHLYLRAERSGGGSGRVYTITIKCTDVNGNTATQTRTVAVPHDSRKK